MAFGKNKAALFKKGNKMGRKGTGPHKSSKPKKGVNPFAKKEKK